nr:PREDICTED: WD repeat-containing protein 66 isoform X1 [Anolis carolinensis]XP_016853170.1 PREDICTED: WD repeat-containing protein 66 isoform X1 [Anolis carolinensis]|eukprot:XP_008119553.1 PREDICTED: WD repeat-containing protein 66 isoform X1 [Anolis carolinensis]
MDEDASKPETPPGVASERQREEMESADDSPKMTDSLSQDTQEPAEGTPDSAGSLEAPQKSDLPEEAPQAGVSPDLSETSKEKHKAKAKLTVREVHTPKEKPPSPSPKEKGHKTPEKAAGPTAGREKAHSPGVVKGEKEQGLEKGQEKKQKQEAGLVATSHRSPRSPEQARSPKEPPSSLAESPTSSDAQGHPQVNQEVSLALRPPDSLSSSEETSVQTTQEDSKTSKRQINFSLTQAEEEKSIVLTAVPGMMFEDESRPLADHPLSLSWVFGYDNKLPVFNLLDDDRRVILYVAGHTAVIHDIFGNKQYLLQGHSSCVSCICVSEDKRWIVTADRSPESLIIIWDGYSAVPVHTIFDSHPGGGVSAVAISHNSLFVATVGAEEVQKTRIWDWTTGETTPSCSVDLLPEYSFQHYVAFSSRDHNELVSNSETQVIFYIWDCDVLHYFAPVLTEKTFDRSVGLFSQSLFHFSTPQAITGTMEGKMALWGPIAPPSKDPALNVKPYNMKVIKLVHLQREGISVLAVTDGNFVTCDTKGRVKFYDGDLQLVHWYSNLKVGPIRSISFNRNPPCPVDVSKYPMSCTLTGAPFVLRNFILSTSNSLVVHIKPEGLKISKCLEEPKDVVHAIACHPSKPLMAKGSLCGLLKVWHYKLDKYLVSRIFKSESIQALCYNHNGCLLAVGFASGAIRLLDSISLENDHPEPMKFSKGPITIMTFSHKSQYFATADEKLSVSVYKQFMKDGQKVWDLLAAVHSHCRPIRSLLFGVHLDSDEPRLLSLGEDKLLVEYDLEKTTRYNLAIHQRLRIEQAATPKCLAWHPPLTTEHFLLMANDAYKMKMYNVTTKMCRKTILGPTYGSPLEKILVLPLQEGRDPQKRYLAYITRDKVGLQVLPVDGNPHKSCTVICHPTGASNLACSYDGCHLFTAGSHDFTVMKWDVNLNALEAVVFLGGKDLIPYYNLLEGGREGLFFKELEDYFYYAQLIHQGINTMEPRKVSTHIPLEQIPFVMQAMGFFPTEDEIENMLNEVKFSEYLETGKQVTSINLGDFIKLYINHRPAFGLSRNEINHAFQILGYEDEDGEPTINRDDLLLLLQNTGEHFTETELAECLTTLLGVNPEGGRGEVGTYDPTGAEVFIEEDIPEEITAGHFTMNLLGLPLPEPTLGESETPISSELS